MLYMLETMGNDGALDPTIANEIALLRAEVTRLEREKFSLTSELEQVQKENRDFATIYKLFERKAGFSPIDHQPPGARASGRTRRDRARERPASWRGGPQAENSGGLRSADEVQIRWA